MNISLYNYRNREMKQKTKCLHKATVKQSGPKLGVHDSSTMLNSSYYTVKGLPFNWQSSTSL